MFFLAMIPGTFAAALLALAAKYHKPELYIPAAILIIIAALVLFLGSRE